MDDVLIAQLKIHPAKKIEARFSLCVYEYVYVYVYMHTNPCGRNDSRGRENSERNPSETGLSHIIKGSLSLMSE